MLPIHLSKLNLPKEWTSILYQLRPETIHVLHASSILQCLKAWWAETYRFAHNLLTVIYVWFAHGLTRRFTICVFQLIWLWLLFRCGMALNCFVVDNRRCWTLTSKSLPVIKCHQFGLVGRTGWAWRQRCATEAGFGQKYEGLWACVRNTYICICLECIDACMYQCIPGAGDRLMSACWNHAHHRNISWKYSASMPSYMHGKYFILAWFSAPHMNNDISSCEWYGDYLLPRIRCHRLMVRWSPTCDDRCHLMLTRECWMVEQRMVDGRYGPVVVEKEETWTIPNLVCEVLQFVVDMNSFEEMKYWYVRCIDLCETDPYEHRLHWSSAKEQI